jgi:hypothetical protein
MLSAFAQLSLSCEAAYGNAEHWERVLGWLEAHMRAGNASAGAES